MQKITPNLWFDQNAEEAVGYYLSIFPDSKKVSESHYPSEGLEEFQKEFAGKVLTIEFELFGQRYVAINAGDNFKFNESVSFSILCKDQPEIDYYWDKLTASGGETSVCGWLKDKYGLSWQVVPENMEELVKRPQGFAKLLKMKKIIIKDF